MDLFRVIVESIKRIIQHSQLNNYDHDFYDHRKNGRKRTI